MYTELLSRQAYKDKQSKTAKVNMNLCYLHWRVLTACIIQVECNKIELINSSKWPQLLLNILTEKDMQHLMNEEDIIQINGCNSIFYHTA